MKSTSHFSRTLLKIGAPALAVGMFLFGGSVVRADSVTTTVTAVGKKNTAPPEIEKDDVKLYQGKEQMQVANWRRGDSIVVEFYWAELECSKSSLELHYLFL